MRRLLTICVLGAALFFYLPVADATTVDFGIFTANGSYYNDPGLNFYASVSQVADQQVNIQFYNASLVESAITRIYFDNGPLLDITNIEAGSDVQFHQETHPYELPGRQLLEPIFEADSQLTVSADVPAPHNGINPGQWLGLTFSLKADNTFSDVVGDLHSGALRIGMHIMGLPDGSSESAANAAIHSVPEPATIIMLGLGSSILLVRRRENK